MYGSGFTVQGLGFWVSGCRLRAEGLRLFGIKACVAMAGRLSLAIIRPVGFFENGRDNSSEYLHDGQRSEMMFAWCTQHLKGRLMSDSASFNVNKLSLGLQPSDGETWKRHSVGEGNHWVWFDRLYLQGGICVTDALCSAQKAGPSMQSQTSRGQPCDRGCCPEHLSTSVATKQCGSAPSSRTHSPRPFGPRL